MKIVIVCPIRTATGFDNHVACPQHRTTHTHRSDNRMWTYIGLVLVVSVVSGFVAYRVSLSLLFLAFMFVNVKRRSQGVVYQEHPSGGTVFWGCSPRTKSVVAKQVKIHCGKLAKRWWGGYYVLASHAWTVREAISHDEENPQLMISVAMRGPLAGVTIIDT